MAITADWYDESHTIIIAKFTGYWTIDEFAIVLGEIDKMTRGLEYPIYAIADGHESKGMPRGSLIPHLKRMFKLPLTHIAVITGSKLAESILNVLTRLDANWQRHITFVSSIEAAHSVIEQQQAENTA